MDHFPASDASSDSVYQTPLETHRTGSKEIVSPMSIAGQSPAALLRVKRTVTDERDGMTFVIQPGDLIRTLRNTMTASTFDAYHIPTDLCFSLSRNCVLPYGTREICGCPDHKCRCVNDDFEKSLAFHRSLEERKAATPEIKLSDPATPEGQAKGALLAIKRTQYKISEFGNHEPKVGDVVAYLGAYARNSRAIRVCNLRTGEIGDILWDTVFPVGTRELCQCKELSYKCRCVYVDFEKSMDYARPLQPLPDYHE